MCQFLLFEKLKLKCGYLLFVISVIDLLCYFVVKGGLMRKKGNIFIYMILVAAVLLTKVLGLVRGILLSAKYGTGFEASAFTAVSNLPLIVFDVTFGTAITSAFVPVFNEKLSTQGNEKANRFASNFFTVIMVFSLVITAVGMLFPRAAVMLVASGFSDQPQTMQLAATLMRIIMPIICFACCTYIFIGVLQSYGEFIAPALVSLFSNLSMIAYLLLLNGRFGVKGLAVAFCFGWFLQFVFLVPFLIKKKFKYTFVLDFKSPDIKRVAVLTLPLFVAALAQPINQLISSNMSSSVSENGVATVNYAYNAYFIVAGVFSYALTNMFFPEMSRKFAQNDKDGASVICRDMLSVIAAIIMPIMIFLSSCSAPVIRILYERGKFTSQDTANVALILSIYALGMLFLSWQDILNKYFYSMQKSVIPMIAAGVGIAVNFILSFLLTKSMGLCGLALSTVIAGAMMTLILCIFAAKRTDRIFGKSFFTELLKVVIGGASVFAVCAVLVRLLDFTGSVIMQIINILIILILSIAVYILVLFILKSENISAVFNALKRRKHPDDIQ